MAGSGADIWGAADAFRFAYVLQTGDFQIVAQVNSIQQTDPWAKAGVMIREALDQSSRHAMMAVTPSNGAIFEQRVASNDVSYATVAPGIQVPRWVKLVRYGSMFRSYYSSDGVNWQFVGEQKILMASTVYVGLAVTAHNNGALCSAAFTNVQILGPQTGDGLTGQYFNTTNRTGLVLTRIDPTINFTWNAGSPGAGVPASNFSVRWTGQVQPQYSETYTFYTTSADGCRLWVNGQLLVNNWIDQFPTENSGTVALTAGQRYTIVMEYYNHSNPSDGVQLSWSSPSQPKQIVPTSALYHDGTYAVAPGLYGSVACLNYPTVVYDVYVPSNYSPGGGGLPIIYTFNPGGGGMVSTLQNSASQLQVIVVGVDASHNGISWQDYSGYEYAVIHDIRTRMNFDPTADFSGGLSGGGWASFDDSKFRRPHVAGVLSMSGWLGGQYYPTDRYLTGLLVARSAGNDGSDGALEVLPPDAHYLIPFGCVIRDWVFAGGHQSPPDSVLYEMLNWLITARALPGPSDRINADIQAANWRTRIQAGQQNQVLRECLAVVLNQPRTYLAHQADIIIDQLMSNYLAFRTLNLTGLATGDFALDYFYYRAYGAGKAGDRNAYSSALLASQYISATSGDHTNDLAGMQSSFGTLPVPPVAIPDSYTTLYQTLLTVPAPGVLGNDYNIDGDKNLTAALVLGSTNGVLQLNPDGSFLYTPSGGFAGTDTFTYAVIDSVGESATTTVSVAVLSNVAPSYISLWLSGTNAVVMFSSLSNFIYNVQTTTDLVSGAWSTIASNIAGTGGILTNIHVGGATGTKRFYRAGLTGIGPVPRTVLASDNAGNLAYTNGWVTGRNGGTGFGSWTLMCSGVSGSSSNGFFLGSSVGNAFSTGPGIDASGASWGLYANSGNLAVGYRGFTASVPTGGVFRIDMDNGYIDGGTVGFVLRTGNVTGSAANYTTGARLRFYFVGGAANYTVADSTGTHDTGVGYTGTGLHLVFTLGTNDNYTLLIINNANNATNTISGTLAGAAGTTIDSVAVFNNNAGSDSHHNAFFNSLQILGP